VGHIRKYSWLVAAALLTICSIRSAGAAEPPADLCSLLPAAEVSKILGQTYNTPEKSVAPRPYANTATGTDCNYSAKAGKLWFRAYVDPSPSAASELFAKLKLFYSPPTPVPESVMKPTSTGSMQSMCARAQSGIISISLRRVRQ
jgi:hypothetical protein